MIRSLKTLMTGGGVSLALLGATPAEAQISKLPEANWRQTDRVEALTKTSSSQNFAFEVRFGAYTPKIDSEFTNGSTPYSSVFGSDTRFYFGLEFDYLPLRIPYVGAIGPGLGWGYTNASDFAKFTNRPTVASKDETSLMIMPMHLSLVARFDELMRRTGVPIVPYGKVGLGLGLWRASDSAGTSKFTKAGYTYQLDKTQDPVTIPSYARGTGSSLGLEFALGGMLSLNFLDPRAAARLDEATSVNHVYVFGEWMNNSNLGALTSPKGMRIGTSTWVVGIAVDM